jgi:hypothetical protein
LVDKLRDVVGRTRRRTTLSCVSMKRARFTR